MDEDNFMQWYQNNFDENAITFAEKYEEMFDEYCYERYIQSPDEDIIYERMKEDKNE